MADTGHCPTTRKGWLITVATRRLTDQIRADTARRLREHLVVSLIPADEQIALAADAAGVNERDETLDLYFMCSHPALSQASQVALTLRVMGGLTTGEIARAFMVPEATMAQRLTRAKQTIKSAGRTFPELTAADRAARLPTVLKVLYLIFNEGYTASGGDALYRLDLSNEAIRVARLLLWLLPDQPEVGGLLALMLLTDARRPARTGPNGELIPLDEQVRSRWNQERISEGKQILERALAQGAVGPYQVQAAIAALHDEAPSTEATDWPQILALYDVLGFQDSPMARLSRAIALAMVDGPAAGLAALDELATGSAPFDPPPARCGSCTPARARRPSCGSDRRVSSRGRAHHEHTGAELPAPARGAAQRVARAVALNGVVGHPFIHIIGPAA